MIICLAVSLANAQKDRTLVLKPGQIYVASDTVYVVSSEKMDTMLYILKDYLLIEQENVVLDSLNKENQKIFVLKDSLLNICENKNVVLQENLALSSKKINKLKKEKFWAHLKGAFYGVMTFAIIETLLGR